MRQTSDYMHEECEAWPPVMMYANKLANALLAVQADNTLGAAVQILPLVKLELATHVSL